MKKIVKILTLFLAVVFLAGCSHRLSDNFPNDLMVSDDGQKIKTLHVDWPVYSTAEELAEVSTEIFSGKIIDIFFEFVNYQTGKVGDTSDLGNTTLYTIYTIEVSENYKGTAAKTEKICRIGGLAGYHEDEQRELLKTINYQGEYIPMCEGYCSPTIGNEYLFCVSRSSGGAVFVINLTQFAHKLDGDNAKNIISACRSTSGGETETYEVCDPRDMIILKLDSYESLHEFFTPDNFAAYPESEYGRYFSQLLQDVSDGSMSLCEPRYHNQKPELWTFDDSSAGQAFLFSREAFNLPWIWYRCVIDDEKYVIGFCYLDLIKDADISEEATYSEISAKLAPSYWSALNIPKEASESYHSIREKKVTLGDGTTVMATVFDGKNDRIKYGFHYKNMLITVWNYYPESREFMTDKLLEALTFERTQEF